MTQRSTLKTASFLLLLASIPQGLQDVHIFHHKALDASVGQNISLPCVLENIQNITVSYFEWAKKEKHSQKLALHALGHGTIYFAPNVSLKTIYNNTELAGTYLELVNVDKDDAGTYICNIQAFPTGSLQRETELRLKGKIECDMNSSIVINLGENVTIQCPHGTEGAYAWTKDEVVVSNSSSLHLQSVSETSAGIYRLTVHTGNSYLQKEFNLTMSTRTSASWSDATTLSSVHNSSSQSEVNRFSPLTTFATENVQKATTTASPVSHSPTVSLENIEITSAITMYEARERFNESVTRESFSDQSNIYSTTQRYNQSESFDVVSEHLNHSVTIHSTASPTIDSRGNDSPLSDGPTDTLDLTATSMGTSSHGNTPDTSNVTVQQDPADAGGRSHLGLTLITMGGVLLIAVAVGLFIRRLIKARMDHPPPFKPPPPPQKYTAIRNPPYDFPRDECHSVTEMKNTIV